MNKNGQEINIITWIVIFLYCTFVLIFLINYSKNFVLTFDAAFNFQVSEELLNGLYATNYDHPVVFYHGVQTGWPFIFPTYLLNMFLGTSYQNMQFVSAFYAAALLFLITKVVYDETNIFTALITSSLVLISPLFIYTVAVGYGEIATEFWIFLVLILLNKKCTSNNDKKYSIVAGIAFGLGFLTKTVFLICTPALLFYIILDLHSSDNRKRTLFSYILFFVSGIIVFLLFELYKCSQLGISEYFNWWREELPEIFAQTGASGKYMSSADLRILEKVLKHANLFESFYHIPLSLICIPLPLVFKSFWSDGNQPLSYILKKLNKSLVFLYTLCFTYVAWWLFLTPTVKTFYRRIIIANTLLIVLCIITLSWVISELCKGKKWATVITLPFICFFIILFTFNSLSALKSTTASERDLKQDSFDVVSYLNDLDNVHMYGVGWWQAPVISSISDYHFRDLNLHEEIVDDGYFILDNYMRKGEADAFSTRVLPRCQAELVYKNNNYSVYSIQDYTLSYYDSIDHCLNIIATNESNHMEVFWDTGSSFNEIEKCCLMKTGDAYITEFPEQLSLLRLDFTSEDQTAMIDEIIFRIYGNTVSLNADDLSRLIVGYNNITTPVIVNQRLSFSIDGPDPFIVFNVEHITQSM